MQTVTKCSEFSYSSENKIETQIKEDSKREFQDNLQEDVFVKNEDSKLNKSENLNKSEPNFKQILNTPLNQNKQIENNFEEIAIANNSTKITPLSLPQKSLDIFKTSFDDQMKNQVVFISEIILMNQQNPEEFIVKTPEPEKGYRIRDLFGRLPFEGVTKEAFIPSYFTESD